MRSVQTAGSTQAQRARISPACLAAAGTAAGCVFRRSVGHVSTFLRPFAPPPLRGFLATMDALTPVGPALRSSASNMNTVSVRRQVSLIHVPDLPIPPSPTTPQALDADFARYPSARRVSRLRGSGLRLSLRRLADSDRPNRVRYPTDGRSPPVAPHPASRRRSYSRLQAGERIPEEDFHLSDQTRFQAH